MDYRECKTEQQFKMLYIKNELVPVYRHVFCIETEETVKGFPDVMCITHDGGVRFFEFKYTKSDRIKFQPTQPAFYRKYTDLDVWVVAYKAKTDRIVQFPVWDMSTTEGERRYHLNEKAEVQL